MMTTDTHPLLQKDTTLIRDWPTWQRLWAKAQYAEELMGLLHIAFDMTVDDLGQAAERFRFMLEIADGYAADPDTFKRPDETKMDGRARLAPIGDVRELKDVRIAIAKKAMRMLCDRAFKSERTSMGVRHHGSVVVPEVFEKLLWFFDDDDRRTSGFNLSRLGDDHYGKIMKDFTYSLAFAGWCRRFPAWCFRIESDSPSIERVSAMFAAARPRFMRMLFRIDQLDFFVGPARAWKDLDEDSMTVLRDVALRSGAGSRFDRHASLEEACCFGSKSASILATIEICRREEARRAPVADAEPSKREADQQLEAARP